MACTISTSGFVADQALAAVMKDSRLPLIAADVVSDLRRDVEAVCSTSPCVWRVLAGVAKCSPADLRDSAVSAALTSSGYILGKLRPAQRPPFDLLTGDPAANLERLSKAALPPDNDVSWKIWKLLGLGYNRQHILEGLRLLGRASWTTTVTEQGHSASSKLGKFHKMYGARMMQDRACLANAAALFSTTPEERKLERAKSKLDRLSRCNYNYLTGRQMLLRELHLTADGFKLQGKRFVPGMVKNLMVLHGKQWRGMIRGQQEKFEGRAALLRQEKQLETQQRREELEAEIPKLQDRASARMGPDTALSFKSARLSPEEILEFEAMAGMSQFRKEVIDADLKRGPKRCLRPHSEVEKSLSRIDLPHLNVAATVLQWLPVVCLQREWFASTAIRIGGPIGGSMWKFIYASKSPYVACLLRLRFVEDMSDITTACARDGILPGDWQFCFEGDLSDWVWTDDSPFPSDAAFACMKDLVAVGGGRFVADGDWVPLEEVLSMFGAKAAAEEPAEEVVAMPAPLAEDSCFDKHPWLLDYLDANPWLPSSGLAGGASVAARKDIAWAEVSDSDAADIFNVLMAKRAEWADEAVDGPGDFLVELLGGTWTKTHLGVDYDAFRGFARGRDAAQFCEMWSLQKSFRCSVLTTTGHFAHMVCTAWCARMQFFYNKFVAEGDGVEYSDATLSAFVEAPDVARAYEVAAGGPVRERIAKLRAMRPIAP